MAITDTITPYIRLIDDLVKDVSYFPGRTAQLQGDYLKRIITISRSDSRREVGNYLRYVIYTLYAEEHERRKADVTKLVLGGEPKVLELSEQMRLTVASLLINACRQHYGEEALAGLSVLTGIPPK